MTPQFLRSEAARFREMAEGVTDREASKQRLLAMATDYEARAKVADALQPPRPTVEAEPEPATEEPAPTVASPKTPSERRARSARTMTLPLTSSSRGL
jgi:hypothetical protein